MAEIGLVASIIAVIQITTAVTTQAYKYGQSVAKAKEDIEHVREELINLEGILKQLKELANRAEMSGESLLAEAWPTFIVLKKDDGPLKECESALAGLKTQLDVPITGKLDRVREGIKWVITKKSKVEQSLSMLRHNKSAFLESLSVSQASQTLDSGKEISRMSKAQIEAKRHEIVKWLSPVDYRADQEIATKKHEDKTGEWFTKSYQYKKWTNEPNSFLWLYGIPGSGKTILSSEIIRETQAYCTGKPEHRFAFFFFSFREEAKQKAINLLSSILAQLVLQIPTIPESLQAFHQKHQHGRPPEDGLFTAIEPLLVGPTFIIADALDECPDKERERKHLCTILGKLHGWAAPNLHILVTSRKEQDLSSALNLLTSSDPISITEEVGADIRKYVNMQLSTNNDLKEYSTETKLKIENVLTKKANGMFRWVDCQLEALKRCPDPEKALKSLPASLDETYERILRSIDSDWQPYEVAALQWVTYSTVPLTLDELYDAIVIDTKSKPWFSFQKRLQRPRRICGILSGLVIVSVDNDVLSKSKDKELIRLAHFSVKEYLESARILRSPDVSVFYASEQKSSLYLTECCLFYIKSYAVSESKTGTEKDSTMFPILEHVCECWHMYASRVKDADSSFLDDLIFEFLSSDLERKVVYKTEEALYCASKLGLYSIVRLLIDTGANVNAQGGYYGNALQIASYKGHEAIVRLLLKKGPDINAQGGHYGTALHAASVTRGQKEVVRLLLEHGADDNAQGGWYGNALQAASAERGDKEVFQLLLEHGAEVNAQGGYYGNAVQAASNHEIKSLLFAYGG